MGALIIGESDEGTGLVVFICGRVCFRRKTWPKEDFFNWSVDYVDWSNHPNLLIFIYTNDCGEIDYRCLQSSFAVCCRLLTICAMRLTRPRERVSVFYLAVHLHIFINTPVV